MLLVNGLQAMILSILLTLYSFIAGVNILGIKRVKGTKRGHAFIYEAKIV